MDRITLNEFITYVSNILTEEEKAQEILSFGGCCGEFDGYTNPISIHFSNGNVKYIPHFKSDLYKKIISIADKAECIKRMRDSDPFYANASDNACIWNLPDSVFGKTFEYIEKTVEGDYLINIPEYSPELKWCIPEIFLNNR